MTSNPTVRHEGDVVVVEVGGDLDVQTGPALREELYALAAQGEADVVLDLSRVGFLDSSGLGVLVGGLKRMRASQGSLRLAGCTAAVADVLNLTGLNRVFLMFEDVPSAVADTTHRVIQLPADERSLA